jgi:hypothetical protein
MTMPAAPDAMRRSDRALIVLSMHLPSDSSVSLEPTGYPGLALGAAVPCDPDCDEYMTLARIIAIEAVSVPGDGALLGTCSDGDDFTALQVMVWKCLSCRASTIRALVGSKEGYIPMKVDVQTKTTPLYMRKEGSSGGF